MSTLLQTPVAALDWTGVYAEKRQLARGQFPGSIRHARQTRVQQALPETVCQKRMKEEVCESWGKGQD